MQRTALKVTRQKIKLCAGDPNGDVRYAKLEAG